MDTKDNLGNLVMGFILILIGIVLLSTLSNSIYLSTNTQDRSNESITTTSQIGTTGNNDVTSVSFFGNATNSTHLANVAVGTDVNFSYDGTITVSGDRFPGDGVYNISYVFEPDEYVSNGTARVLMAIIPIFFALAVLAGGIVLAMRGLRGFIN